MVMTFHIEGRNGNALGKRDEVIKLLSSAFPDATYRLVEEYPKEQLRAEYVPSFHIRILQKLFAPRPITYPRYEGSSESYSVEFYFEEGEIIDRIEMHCWGIRDDRDKLFVKLFEETGWRPSNMY